jgi:hypothetical protein
MRRDRGTLPAPRYRRMSLAGHDERRSGCGLAQSLRRLFVPSAGGRCPCRKLPPGAPQWRSSASLYSREKMQLSQLNIAGSGLVWRRSGRERGRAGQRFARFAGDQLEPVLMRFFL